MIAFLLRPVCCCLPDRVNRILPFTKFPMLFLSLVWLLSVYKCCGLLFDRIGRRCSCSCGCFDGWYSWGLRGRFILSLLLEALFHRLWPYARRMISFNTADIDIVAVVLSLSLFLSLPLSLPPSVMASWVLTCIRCCWWCRPLDDITRKPTGTMEEEVLGHLNSRCPIGRVGGQKWMTSGGAKK